MFYHVRVGLRSEGGHGLTETDLTREQLMERVVTPCRQGRPITVCGRSVPPRDIREVLISQSEGSARDVVDRLKAEEVASTVKFVAPYEWVAADRAADVTSRFLV